ncbi:hypothetical protein [Streptomyces goshikiensis]|uniref:hypothetical protein n=1 Tax=Streptomyces goshikiensis TaxID=1942 RepID=UPI0034058265
MLRVVDLGERDEVVDIQSGRVGDDDVVVGAAPGSAGELAAGRDRGPLDGFGEDDLLAGVTAVRRVQPAVPVLVQVPLVAFAVLDGYGEPVVASKSGSGARTPDGPAPRWPGA